MKRFALTLIALALVTSAIHAAGYGAAPGFSPGCATCPEAAPLPQAQLSYVPRTVQFAETVTVPEVVYRQQTIVRQKTVYEPQLSFSPPQAAIYPPVRAPHCGGYTIQRAPGCYGNGVAFAPVRARSFARVGAGVSYGFNTHNVGVGAFASARGGRFVAGSPGFTQGGFVGKGFVGGGFAGTSVAARNVAVTAAPGQQIDVRTGGLRGVLFGARVRVR